MKNITQVISSFSKKLSRFEEAEDKAFVKPVSKDADLQKKINLSQEEKLEKIKAQYEKYINPVSKEIEEDEEAVLSALRIFKAARLAEEAEASSKSDRQTSIHQIDFKSPICQKQEYVYGKNLLYLTYWLQTVHGEKEWIPSIYKFISGERFLEFIPAESKHYDYEEIAILNVLKSLNQQAEK